jgi:hypoxanthine phosphoribosyltransferase
VQIRKDLDCNIYGKDVLIVEDIMDSGQTLAHLKGLLSARSRHRCDLFAAGQAFAPRCRY